MATVYKRAGSSVYHASIIVNGERKRFSTNERNRREAQKKADEAEEQQNKAAAERSSISLLTAADKFFTFKERNRPLRPKTVEGYKNSLTNIYGILGDFPLASLTEEIISDYVRHRLMEGKKVALRNDLAFLSTLYSSARHFEKGLKINPVKDFDKRDLPRAAERTTWLRSHQIKAVMDCCTQPYQRLFVMLAVMTGMRSGEVKNLKWSDIDFNEPAIYLGNVDALATKNGTYRIIPIPPVLLEALVEERDRRHRIQSEYVLVNPKTRGPYQSFKTFWGRVQRETGMEDLRIHDLRHTYASWSKQKGIDEIAIMNIMGHKTRSMVKRYAHTSTEHLKASVDKLGNMGLDE